MNKKEFSAYLPCTHKHEADSLYEQVTSECPTTVANTLRGLQKLGVNFESQFVSCQCDGCHERIGLVHQK